MALTMVKATFQPGSSLSSSVSFSSGRLIRIRTPAVWTPANLTFRITSVDTAEYRPLHHREGGEVMLNTVLPNTVIGIPSEVAEVLQDAFVKIHSGHAGQDIPQAALCEFELMLYRGSGATATLLPAGIEA